MSAAPFTLVIRSRLLDRDVWIVPDRMRLLPKQVIVLTWAEAGALLGSGVTREDLPRLLKIRAEFSGSFEPTSDVRGFAPSVALSPSPTPPAPVADPGPQQQELFA